MSNMLWTDQIIQDLRALSDSTLTDTCTFYPFNVPVDPTSSTPTYIQNNQGGVIQTFNESDTDGDGPGSAIITDIPCRMDVNVKGLVPQRSKDDITAEKIIRYVYIPISVCVAKQFTPRIQDQIETSAGDPLGRTVRYRILEVDVETDNVDVEMLVEVVT